MLLNQARARDFMRQCGLDVLIATSPVNITYFSDYHCWIDPLFKEYMMQPGASSNLSQGYALFPAEGEPALVISQINAANALDLWVRDVNLFSDAGFDTSLPRRNVPHEIQDALTWLDASPQHGTATDALLHGLQKRGLMQGKIGIELEGLTLPARDQLLAALPAAAIKDCSNLIRLLRAVKSPDEITRLRRAAQITESAARESLALARVGHPANVMVESFRAGVAARGADFDHFIFGVRGIGFAAEPQYTLASDDVLEVDFGCIYQHCFADSGTTLAMQPLSDELQLRYSALHGCIARGAAAMHPNVRASTVHSVMKETLAAQGITASFPHGHSLGLEVRDYPIVVANNGLHIRDDCVDVPSDLALEADMVINLEAAIRLPTIGSLHIEQTFLITPNGSEHLVQQDRTQPFIPSL